MNYEKMTKAELLKEMEKIQKQLNSMREVAEVKNANELNINGITCKDIAVRYGMVYDDENPNYSFYVKHGRKLYNIYYDKGTYDKKHDFTYYSWWPADFTQEEDWDKNRASEFIPSGFSEASEDMYEFRGDLKKAIECLNKYGITDIAKGDWQNE